MENWAFEFHDSELQKVEENDGNLALFFGEAVLHKSVGRPGQDDGSVWCQPVMIEIEKGQVESDVPIILGYVTDGELAYGNTTVANVVQLPLRIESAVRLRMAIIGSSKYVTISGLGIKIDRSGTPSFLREFSRHK